MASICALVAYRAGYWDATHGNKERNAFESLASGVFGQDSRGSACIAR